MPTSTQTPSFGIETSLSANSYVLLIKDQKVYEGHSESRTKSLITLEKTHLMCAS